MLGYLVGGERYEMIEGWGTGGSRISQNNRLPLSMEPSEGESGISLTFAERGSPSASENSPSDGYVPRSPSPRPQSKRSLKASIWMKLTLFIGTLVWYPSVTQLCMNNVHHYCTASKVIRWSLCMCHTLIFILYVLTCPVKYDWCGWTRSISDFFPIE